jgi:uncharacterized protein (TIGR02391 family)
MVNVTASGYIKNLWIKSKLGKKFTVDDILKSAEEQGYTFERQTVRKALVRAKYIAKPKKNNGKITYSQKYPPESIPENSTTSLHDSIFDKLDLHLKIRKVSSKLFLDGHYSQAIFETVKILEKEIKSKSGIKDKSGTTLVNLAFNKEHPIIWIVEGNESWQIDEREGFRFLFMGAFTGIKNPKSHDNPDLSDPGKALEYLSFISLLMKRLDESTIDN